MEKRKPEFWLHVGDLVGSGGNMAEWDTYLNELKGLAEYSSFMPVIGNHEYYGEETGEPYNFKEIFALPGNESTFAFFESGGRVSPYTQNRIKSGFSPIVLIENVGV